MSAENQESEAKTREPIAFPPVPGSASGSFVRMFKPQFAPLVESGAKRQTVRPTPKRMPKPGDRISLRAWSGSPYRSKQRVLRDAVIERVAKIRITIDGFEHWEWQGHGARSNAATLHDFAVRDGFEDWPALVDWFAKQHGLPFDGVLIVWQNHELSDSHENLW